MKCETLPPCLKSFVNITLNMNVHYRTPYTALRFFNITLKNPSQTVETSALELTDPFSFLLPQLRARRGLLPLVCHPLFLQYIESCIFTHPFAFLKKTDKLHIFSNKMLVSCPEIFFQFQRSLCIKNIFL